MGFVCTNQLATDIGAQLTISQVGAIALYINTIFSKILNKCECGRNVFLTSPTGTTIGQIGKHQWDVRLVDLLSNTFIIVSLWSCLEMSTNTAQTSAITVMIAPITLLFIKLTFFLLYFQVFRPLRWLRVTVYIGATLTCAFYGAASIAQIVFSAPKPGQSWIEHTLSGTTLHAEVLAIPLSAVGLGIDIVLLVMPIVAIMGLQLPKKRKIGIMLIFMFGIL